MDGAPSSIIYQHCQITLTFLTAPQVLRTTFLVIFISMKFTRATIIIALATAAVARNCTPGLKYCGRTLLEIGM